MHEQLSSRWTVFVKLVAPLVAAMAILMSVINFVRVGEVDAAILPLQILGLAVAVWFIARTFVPLKNVVAVEGGLVVDNFISVSKIRYQDILDVRESSWALRHLTVVRLRRPGRFGARIVYLPYTVFLDFSSNDHPASRKLRERIALAAATPPAA